MTLLVQDEEDVLREHLLFHLDRGVDFVIVTDNDSRDGTADILEEFRRSGEIRVIHEPANDYAQRRWVTAMARMAAAEHSADWVINSDADEFWWPSDGDLKSVLARVRSRYTQVAVPRYNFVPVATTGGNPLSRMVVRERSSVNVFGKPLPPKICHRADPDVTVEQGNHIVRGGSTRRYPRQLPIEILHFPMRSFEQYRNRVVRGGQAYERNEEVPRAFGAHWRTLYERFKEGSLPEYWAEEVYDAGAIDRGVEEGRLVVDRRLADALPALVRRLNHQMAEERRSRPPA